MSDQVSDAPPRCTVEIKVNGRSSILIFGASAPAALMPPAAGHTRCYHFQGEKGDQVSIWIDRKS